MQFRLTYEGPLYGSSKKDTRADHKHCIRRKFHKQLKKLWSENQTLRHLPHGNYVNAPQIDPAIPRWQGLALRFRIGNYHFVPLVMEELALSCSLHILFLRPDPPGLDQLNDVDAVNANKALALIARDIAKRRKALAPALAEHRRKQRQLRRFMRGGG